MFVTVFETWHTSLTIRRVPHVQWLTLLALLTHRVIMALETLFQLIGTGAVRVSVTLALDATIRTDVTEIALAFIRLDAHAPNAPLRTFGDASARARVVTSSALAHEPIAEVDAYFAVSIAAVVVVETLVFGRATNVVPREIQRG